MLALLSLLISAALADEHPGCNVDPQSRVDAWDGEYDLRDCEPRGFCWHEAPPENPGPSCYHHAEIEGHATEGECTAARQLERRDCLSGGGSAEECVSRGCCWTTSSEDGVPFCYYTVGAGTTEEF